MGVDGGQTGRRGGATGGGVLAVEEVVARRTRRRRGSPRRVRWARYPGRRLAAPRPRRPHPPGGGRGRQRQRQSSRVTRFTDWAATLRGPAVRPPYSLPVPGAPPPASAACMPARADRTAVSTPHGISPAAVRG